MSGQKRQDSSVQRPASRLSSTMTHLTTTKHRDPPKCSCQQKKICGVNVTLTPQMLLRLDKIPHYIIQKLGLMPELGTSLLQVVAVMSPTDGITPPQTSYKSRRC